MGPGLTALLVFIALIIIWAVVLKRNIVEAAILSLIILPFFGGVDQAPGLTPERVGSMNDKIKEMCKERGFYYLNLTEAFTGEDGYLTADYAQNDGIHLTVAGYSHWMDYLCTHVPYNKNNPYQQGSTYCLSDELRQLIADLP